VLFVKKAMFYLSAVVNILLGLVGIGIHIWTIVIVYGMHNVLGAIVAACLPIVSQIYLIITAYGYSHTLFNQYTVIVGAYVISGIVIKVLIAVCSPKEQYNT
jgi:hypothetical protein